MTRILNAPKEIRVIRKIRPNSCKSVKKRTPQYKTRFFAKIQCQNEKRATS
jgi:hypothetical protein